MTDGGVPVRWVGRQALVAFPEHVNVSNAGQVGEQLVAALNDGADVVIADMSATASCDQAGAAAVAGAYQQAVVRQAELRLVLSAPGVRQFVSADGLDRLVAVYPSVEAALAAGSAGQSVRPDYPVQSPSAPQLQAGQGNGAGPAALTAVVLRQLIDTLGDGIALTGEDGTILLANRRLAAMFGYEHGELAGQPVESLVPADLRGTHRKERAAYQRDPVARPMAERTRLVAVAKDGTTIPVVITLSPVPTANGHFILAVVRDITQPLRRDDLADLAKAAAAEQAHHAQELLNQVVHSLFHAGLSLQAAADLPAEVARERIGDALGRLDDTIHEVRDHAFRFWGPGRRRGDAP